MTPRRAWLLLGGVILVWGLHWSVTKVGLETMPPLTYAMARVLVGAVALALLMRHRGRLAPPDRGDLPVILSYGLLAIAAATALMIVALVSAPAGRSSILSYTLPLWVVPIMALATRTLPTGREVLGLGLGLAGLMVLLNPLAMDWSSTDALLAAGMLLLNAAAGAVALVHVRLHPWRGTPFDVQLWQLLVALVPLAILAFLLERPMSVAWDLQTVLVLAYSGVLATAFAYWAEPGRDPRRRPRGRQRHLSRRAGRRRAGWRHHPPRARAADGRAGDGGHRARHRSRGPCPTRPGRHADADGSSDARARPHPGLTVQATPGERRAPPPTGRRR
ncbi:MAG: DMT family transporter [Chloroflexota bacterium]